MEIARQLSDSKLEASVLAARLLVNLRFLRVRETVTDGLFSERLGGSALPPWQHAMSSRCLHAALLQAARPEQALRIADELEPFARGSAS